MANWFLRSARTGKYSKTFSISCLIFLPVRPTVGADQKIFLDRQILEDLPALRDHGNPGFDDSVRIQGVDRVPQKLDGPAFQLSVLCFQDAGNGFQGGRLAGPVGPQQGDHRAFRNLQRDPLKDQDHLIVNHFNIIDFEHEVSGYIGSRFKVQGSRLKDTA